MTNSAIPEMLPLKEAAARTGLSYDWLRKACLRGELVHIRCGTKILINFGALCRYLETNTGQRPIDENVELS